MNPCTNLLIVPSLQYVVSDKERKQSIEEVLVNTVSCLPFSQCFLKTRGENKQQICCAMRFHYFCICRKGIGLSLNIQVLHFVMLFIFSTHSASPWLLMCYVWCMCCPECYWASVQNCRHLNTAAGVLPTSIIGHMWWMTVADKALHAIFHWFIHSCTQCFSLNANLLLTGTQGSSLNYVSGVKTKSILKLVVYSCAPFYVSAVTPWLWC